MASGIEITDGLVTTLEGVALITGGVYRGTAARAVNEDHPMPFVAVNATTESSTFNRAGILQMDRSYSIEMVFEDKNTPSTLEVDMENTRRAVLKALTEWINASKRVFQPDVTFNVTIGLPDTGSDFAVLKIDLSLTYPENFLN